MIHTSLRHYSNGKKKSYSSTNKAKRKVPRSDKNFKFDYTPPRRGSVNNIKSLDTTEHDTYKRNTPEYTGDLVKGISTMHKSNAVPVISEQELKDHANMRR